jgi:hypothetical protein
VLIRLLNNSQHPFLNSRVWKQLTFKNVCRSKLFHAVLQSALCSSSGGFVVLTKAIFMLVHTLTFWRLNYFFNFSTLCI